MRKILVIKELPKFETFWSFSFVRNVSIKYLSIQTDSSQYFWNLKDNGFKFIIFEFGSRTAIIKALASAGLNRLTTLSGTRKIFRPGLLDNQYTNEFLSILDLFHFLISLTTSHVEIPPSLQQSCYHLESSEAYPAKHIQKALLPPSHWKPFSTNYLQKQLCSSRKWVHAVLYFRECNTLKSVNSTRKIV